MAATAYDTAWIALVPRIGTGRMGGVPFSPQFPASLEWLRRTQSREDWSWGGNGGSRDDETTLKLLQNKTLNTLAALIALQIGGEGERDAERVERGTRALNKMLPELMRAESGSSFSLVGFKSLLPALVKLGTGEGRLPSLHPDWKLLYKETARKRLSYNLHRTDCWEKYSGWMFCLEALAFADKEEEDEIASKWDPNALLLRNGSLACAPASTAYALRILRLKGSDLPAAESYLGELCERGKGGVPSFNAEIFEIAWGLQYLWMGGISLKDDPRLASPVRRLWGFWQASRKEGVSHTPWIHSDPDCDCSAVAAHVLLAAGYPVDLKAILQFFDGEKFVTAWSEEKFTVSTNLHAVMALRVSPGGNEEILGKWLPYFDSIISKEKSGPVIPDKWHLSPYYIAMLEVFALSGLREEVVKGCVRVVLKSQRRDGGWGLVKSSHEETAYCVLLLCHVRKSEMIEVSGHVLLFAENFLKKRPILPGSLWSGKVLYDLPTLSEVAVEAALAALGMERRKKAKL